MFITDKKDELFNSPDIYILEDGDDSSESEESISETNKQRAKKLQLILKAADIDLVKTSIQAKTPTFMSNYSVYRAEPPKYVEEEKETRVKKEK